MKTKTEIHIRPERVSVFEGGVQVINVLREQCSPDRLPGVAVALAKGMSTASAPITLREFAADGRETHTATVQAEPRTPKTKRAKK